MYHRVYKTLDNEITSEYSVFTKQHIIITLSSDKAALLNTVMVFTNTPSFNCLQRQVIAQLINHEENALF